MRPGTGGRGTALLLAHRFRAAGSALALLAGALSLISPHLEAAGAPNAAAAPSAAAPNATEPGGDLAEAARPGAGSLVRLEVFPPRAEVVGIDRAVALVVTGVYQNGGVRDLTGEVSYSVSDPSLLAVDRQGVATPLADGTVEVRISAFPPRPPRGGDAPASAGGESAVPDATAGIVVSRTASPPPLNFANDLVPIFSKHGCNAGGCHGKSGGQNGFQLSLFGFTPAVDYQSLTRDSRGRRVFPAAPEHSLLLRKATGTLPHGGGERFKADSPEARLLHRWMRSGMPLGRPDDPRVERITVYPRHRALAPGWRQQLRVDAHYSDGSVVDVSRRAEFSLGEEGYLQTTSGGLVTALDLPGQGAVLVRYQGQVGFFRATIPHGIEPVKLARTPERNFIDRHVFARLDLLGLPSSEVTNDADFLRRAFLDICGTQPTAQEAERFLDDRDPAKREKLIDRLLERPEYASFFSLFWADLLRNRRGGENRAAPLTIGFHRWIYEGLISNKRFDSFVREILCAEGSVADNPPVGWYRSLENPKELVDDTGQVFLGIRFQCARCHHHPFEKWGQEDYWSFANFFSRLSRKNDRLSRGFTISRGRGASSVSDDEPTSASYRKTYRGLKLPGGPALAESADEDPRERLWEWMVAPENPRLAREVVNRYWKHFLGRGIVEPEDDLRETNPPSNPELLEALAADFALNGYDLRRLVRTICGSATYQLRSEPVEVVLPSGEKRTNRHDRQNFSRFQPRRLSAEVLLDAIDQVTGAKTRFQGVLREARAIDLPDESSRSYFLEVFGKPDRSSACACERSGDATLSQVLHLLNSREMQGKLSAGEGRAALLARDPRPDPEKVRELFLAVFARRPTREEEEKTLAHLSRPAEEKDAEAGRRRAWEDLLWALLNSKEFLFNR